MYKVGLTGGIGSGKTTVAKIFETLGIAIFYADTRAKELMHRQDVRTLIEAEFSSFAYTDQGQLDTKFIAQTVFGDSAKLLALNAIVHPLLGQDFLAWAQLQTSPYVIEEAAVLVESGAHLLMDAIIVVDAPLEMRIERVIARDNVAREAVEARIAAQMTSDEIVKYANYTIDTQKSDLLIKQIEKIDSEIRKKIVSLSSEK